MQEKSPQQKLSSHIDFEHFRSSLLTLILLVTHSHSKEFTGIEKNDECVSYIIVIMVDIILLLARLMDVTDTHEFGQTSIKFKVKLWNDFFTGGACNVYTCHTANSQVLGVADMM